LILGLGQVCNCKRYKIDDLIPINLTKSRRTINIEN